MKRVVVAWWGEGKVGLGGAVGVPGVEGKSEEEVCQARNFAGPAWVGEWFSSMYSFASASDGL